MHIHDPVDQKSTGDCADLVLQVLQLAQWNFLASLFVSHALVDDFGVF